MSETPINETENIEAQTSNNNVDATFMERIQKAKSDAKEKVFQKKNSNPQQPKLPPLTDVVRSYAKRMLPLLQSEGYRALGEFLNVKIVEHMSNIFTRPSEAIFDTKNNDRAEWISFNQGMVMGLQLARDLPNKILETYINEQSQESK